MSTTQMFSEFLDNLQVSEPETISGRYGSITQILNQYYRDTDSKTANSLKVGSFGRGTEIKGISDLDMIYMMPQSQWERFRNGRQSALLQEVKNAIKKRYSTTYMRGDGQVVQVSFGNSTIEVVPAFEKDNGDFTFPDTNNGGSWKVTKPRKEKTALTTKDQEKNYNLKRLCKMVRAWKNHHGVGMGGLLIDTLAYNFLNSTSEYDDKSFAHFDQFSRDFFAYLRELPEQDSFVAPGSGQHVFVKEKFKGKAQDAQELCQAAIAAEGEQNVNSKWKQVFGRPFPASQEARALKTQERITESGLTYRNTEEYIEDYYQVDIRYELKIDCTVSQKGFRPARLSQMLTKNIPLFRDKSLEFFITRNETPGFYQIKWKILNKGPAAKERDQIRGQIIADQGKERLKESTDFRGPHLVECYIVKGKVVVARASIRVPIREK